MMRELSLKDMLMLLKNIANVENGIISKDNDLRFLVAKSS
jgi:hypothetical protein